MSRALFAIAMLMAGAVSADTFRQFRKNGQVVTSGGTQVAEFEMLTAGTPSVPGTVTWSRASEEFCPGGSEDSSGSWVTNNTPCTNNYGAAIWKSATNPVLRSETAGTGWTLQDVTVTSDQSNGPDGTATADRIVASATTAIHRWYQGGMSLTNGSVYTLSTYYRAGTVGHMEISVNDGGSLCIARVNLTTHAATTVSCSPNSASSTAVGGGLYRFVFTFTSTNTTAGGFVILHICNNPSLCSATGWTGAGEYVDVVGVQLEPGDHATPYIRTAGTAVTRQADVASISTPAAVTDSVGCAGATVYAKKPTSGQRIYGFGATNRLALSSTTAAHFFDSANTITGTALSTVADRQVVTIADWSGSAGNISHDGQTGTGSYDGAFLGATVYLGSDGTGNFLDGYLENLKIDNTTSGCD